MDWSSFDRFFAMLGCNLITVKNNVAFHPMLWLLTVRDAPVFSIFSMDEK